MSKITKFYITIAFVFIALPHVSFAAPLEISGWIPYWRKATGTQETLLHIDNFKEVNPFGYTVKNDGTLFDALKIDEDPWSTLIQTAHAKKIRVIPTVMWSNTEVIHAVLKNAKKRRALEEEIANVVKQKGFDGIDIDFEGKKAETKEYFSLFLKGLYQRMGKKMVMCSIEARTPLDSRFDIIPKDIRYANDFVALNKYCDRVRLMTYDQGAVDLRLNESALDPYIPIADPQWVEKVVRLTAKTISKKKIVIGVAPYGYEYKVTKLTDAGYRYNLLWAFNPRYATELAAELGIIPTRNKAGELSFVYNPAASSTPPVILRDITNINTATDTALSNNMAIATTSFSSAINTATSTAGKPFNIVWWSDASAIKDKIVLAKKLGVRGIAIFKIDGGGDPALWDVLH